MLTRKPLACSQRYHKLRKNSTVNGGGSDADGLKTPAKGGAKKKFSSQSKSTGKRKAKKEFDGMEEEDQDDEEESPIKKPKVEVKKEIADEVVHVVDSDDEEALL